MDDLKTLSRAQDVLARRRSATIAQLQGIRASVSTTKRELECLGEQRRDLERHCETTRDQRRRATTASGLHDNDRNFRDLVDEANELVEQSAQSRRRLELLRGRQQSLYRQLVALASKSDYLGDRHRRGARRQARR